jgi:ribosomal protein L7/L12
MNTQLLLVIGAVIVAIVLVIYWQRQGVVKRPSPTVDADTVKSELVDWLAETDSPSLLADWGDGLGLNQEQIAQINTEIVAKRKINAIKLYREFTGEGLKEAKEAIEAIERGQKPTSSAYNTPSAGPPAGDLMAQIEAELRAGRKINAIKLYREAHNVGLKEAKDAIDEMERKLSNR